MSSLLAPSLTPASHWSCPRVTVTASKVHLHHRFWTDTWLQLPAVCMTQFHRDHSVDSRTHTQTHTCSHLQTQAYLWHSDRAITPNFVLTLFIKRRIGNTCKAGGTIRQGPLKRLIFYTKKGPLSKTHGRFVMLKRDGRFPIQFHLSAGQPSVPPLSRPSSPASCLLNRNLATAEDGRETDRREKGHYPSLCLSLFCFLVMILENRCIQPGIERGGETEQETESEKAR